MCLQCCNYCARHRLKDKLKAIPTMLRATPRRTAALQHEGERRHELLEKHKKAVQGTRKALLVREGGEVERKSEPASWRRQHLNWSSRREDCNRTGVPIPSEGGVVLLPSLNKLLALLGQPHLPSLLIIQGTSHTDASGSLRGHRLLQPRLQERPMSQPP